MRCRAESPGLRLAQAVETQFDTTVVAAFEAILAGADEDYRLARGADFLLGYGTRRDQPEECLARSGVSASHEHLVASDSLRSGSDSELLEECRT